MLVEITGKRNEEQLTTTSRKVAEIFGKEHKNVLYAIEGNVHVMERDALSAVVEVINN